MFLQFYVVLSHIFAIPALLFTFKRFNILWLEFYSILSIVFWSLAYHICFEYNLCIVTDKRSIQIIDNCVSIFAITIVAAYILKIDNIKLKLFYYIYSIHVNLFTLAVYGMSDKEKIVYAASTIGMGIILFFVQGAYKRLHYQFVGFVIVLLAIGCVVFALYQFALVTHTAHEYWVTHGFWHTFIFLALFFGLKSRYPTYNERYLMRKLRKHEKITLQLLFTKLVYDKDEQFYDRKTLYEPQLTKSEKFQDQITEFEQNV